MAVDKYLLTALPAKRETGCLAATQWDLSSRLIVMIDTRIPHSQLDLPAKMLTVDVRPAFERSLMMNEFTLPIEEVEALEAIARRVRLTVLQFATVKRVHIGPALSIIDILVALYFKCLKISPSNLFDEDRDRFILSKGHAAFGLYAVLLESGILDQSVMDDFASTGNSLPGHPCKGMPGVEFSTGSLGHGLPIGAGMSIAGRLNSQNYRTVVLMGDGELNEGSVWESAMFCAHNNLNQLTAIVDRNHFQQEGLTRRVMNMDPLTDKWGAFGWNVIVVNGHSIPDVVCAIGKAAQFVSGPTVIVADTIKGKGVTFMENNPDWHMGYLDSIQFGDAVASIRAEAP